MKACPDRAAALALLRKYNTEPFHLQHALTVEAVMGWYAQNLGYEDEAEFWSAVGLLHDVDFEKWPEEHCKKAPELLAEIGCSEELIHAVCSHGYGLELCLGIACPGIIAGRTLGTCARRKGCILLIRARHHHAVVETHGGAYVKFAVRRISTVACLAGSVHEFEFLRRELIVA